MGALKERALVEAERRGMSLVEFIEAERSAAVRAAEAERIYAERAEDEFIAAWERMTDEADEIASAYAFELAQALARDAVEAGVA